MDAMPDGARMSTQRAVEPLSELSAGVLATLPVAEIRGAGNKLPRPPEPQGPIISLTVRSARLSDIAKLRAVGDINRLNQPEAQLESFHQFGSMINVSGPWLGGRRRFFVADGGERIVGFAHFQPMAPDRRWLLTTLGSATGVYNARPVWDALLSHAIIDAGLRGVKRLYARAPTQSPIVPALLLTGFVPYAQETILAALLSNKPSSVDKLQPQEEGDTWAIHQLYNAAVPRQVQYAEAYTSHRWDLRGRDGESRSRRIAGWLIEEGHDVVGYARTRSRGGNHVVELVHHPERVALLPALIDGALAGLSASQGMRVLCAVRGYQAEVATLLHARGFASILEQDLHVKYTTANVRLPAFEQAPFHLEVRDKLPKRVPSFLHGTPRDESVT